MTVGHGAGLRGVCADQVTGTLTWHPSGPVVTTLSCGGSWDTCLGLCEDVSQTEPENEADTR